MTQLVYAHTRTPELTDGRTYSNPRFFNGAVKGATKVFVEPGYPKIVAAYEAAGVPVQVIGEEAKPKAQPKAARSPSKKKAAEKPKAAPAAPAEPASE